MKKLFSIVSMIVLILGLSACTNTSDYQALQEDYESLQQQLSVAVEDLQEEQSLTDDLKGDKEDLTEQIAQLEASITELEAEIDALQARIYDSVITVQFTNLTGNTIKKTIGFNDDYAGTLFDLLNENVDLTYTDGDYGKYLNTIENITPTTGSFIAFYKNSEMSMLGVESQTFEDGDHFSFEIQWYDMTAKAVYESIHLFLDNQVDDYVNETTTNYQVIAALNLLDMTTDYTDLTTVKSQIDASEFTSINQYYKALITLNSVDADITPMLNDAVALLDTGAYGLTAYSLIIANMDETRDYATFRSDALTYFNENPPLNQGLDTGGISLVALSSYDDISSTTLLTDYAMYIQENQLPSGGVKTMDSTYNDVVYPGTENAASMAQVILGLIANNIDPSVSEFTYLAEDDTTNLVYRLTEFQTETGSFDWNLTDDIAEDKLFSTPQAFLAVVVYHTYINRFEPVNPYDFN
ncbi:MAG: hypothetical protein K9L74_06030 [Candidatus Izimaplasma sp.]|nr:hypothetical protein [Candidatus Izimaplasma bacterium]